MNRLKEPGGEGEWPSGESTLRELSGVSVTDVMERLTIHSCPAVKLFFPQVFGPLLFSLIS
jgi:hypothetical protein